MKVFPHTNKSTFVIGERLNRFSSMIIDKIRRVVKAKQQETTEVSENTKHKHYESIMEHEASECS